MFIYNKFMIGNAVYIHNEEMTDLDIISPDL